MEMSTLICHRLSITAKSILGQATGTTESTPLMRKRVMKSGQSGWPYPVWGSPSAYEDLVFFWTRTR